MQYQAICSKANKKLTISLTANNIDEARSILHGQGYSIMEIKELEYSQTENNKGNFFYFDIRVNWQIKTWKIQSDDVFKSYKKLIDDLGYDVVYIYTNEWMNEEQKKTITAKVRDSYRMYKATLGENIDQAKQTKEEVEMKEISPEILKEVEKYGLIIDSTIEKIQNLLLKYHSIIPWEKKSELDTIMHTLLQSKWSSNLWKIKLNTENALTSVWNIELELVKTWKEEEKAKFLKETNSLLKQIWSSSRIETGKNQDIWKMFNDFFWRFNKKEPTQVKEQKKVVDKNSFIYFKNQRELGVYKEILGKNDILIVKTIFTFQWSKLKRLFLKKKLLQQNIQIIDNRIHNKNISYTKIVHGVQYYVDFLNSTVSYISRVWIYIIFLFIFFYITLNITTYFGLIEYSFQNNKSLLYITLLSYIVFLFTFVRSAPWFVISIILAFYGIVYLSINF
jgi:hypothetical protein